MAKAKLSISIRSFFEQHLVSQRGLGAHTVLAYRDAMWPRRSLRRCFREGLLLKLASD